jgi:quercetin dioxygenase-like cupin family protein
METLLQEPEAPARAKPTVYKVLGPREGLRLHSGPGRDLVFKVTGEDTGGAFDYFTVDVAPHGGPPLHVHHRQEETIHVLKGRYKVRIGEEIFYLQEGGFAYLPSKVPHAFLNLTEETGEIIVVYTPGGGHRFYEEFGPAARNGPPDPKVLGPLFAKYDMALLGPPLSPD